MGSVLENNLAPTLSDDSRRNEPGNEILHYSQRVANPATRKRLLAILFCALVLLVLVALCPCKFGGRSKQAKLAAVHNDLFVLNEALSTFDVDTGRFPTTTEGLQVLSTAPPNQSNWHGPYIAHRPIDPWGNLYIYRYPTKTGFDLRSAGPDGIADTADTADDITPLTHREQ